MARKKPRNNNAGGSGSIRIIGGSWRGRRLPVASAPGLRPTSDRTRETLFNWLAPVIAGARCLDLFAGTGALGLEALSRGAASCDFVDSNPACCRQITENLRMLQAAGSGRCHNVPAATFLADDQGPYDIVFLDPPFGDGLLAPAAAALAGSDALGDGARIYVETARGDFAAAVPASWVILRQKQAGGVEYGLCEPASGAEPAV